MAKVNYSVVIPVYNSEKTLNNLFGRLNSLFQELDVTYEIIFVNDFSKDDSWDVLTDLYDKKKNIKIINLSRNFGQHNATLCGFSYADGEYLITLDDDLQHPPEEIIKLIKKIDEGYSVVYGKYMEKKHAFFENILSYIFQKVIHKILAIPSQLYLSSFAIYDNTIAKNMCSVKNSYPFLPALMSKTTPIHKVGNVDVYHNERKIGKSNYNIISHFKFSLNLLINYSSLPLTAIGIGGFLVSIFSLLFGISIIVQKSLDPNYGLMGWNSLMVAITLLGGSILMSVAIVGEYLRRILTEVSYGQQYLVDKAEL